MENIFPQYIDELRGIAAGSKIPFFKVKLKYFFLTLTGRSLSALGFLQIYRNKRAQQRKFYAYIFSEQLFGENVCP